MNIIELIKIIKKKIRSEIDVQDIVIIDKSYLHKKHKNYQKNRYHLKIEVKSEALKKISKLESSKKIYKILNKEMKDFIHSIQISIS